METLQHKRSFGQGERMRMSTEGGTYEKRLTLKMGLLLAGAQMLYFLFMKLIGMEANLNLRYGNGVFYVLILILTYVRFRKVSGENIKYFRGLILGVKVSFIGALIFALFFGIYLSIDDEFMAYVQKSIEYGSHATPLLTAFGLFTEGLVGGSLIAFVLMPMFKAR